MKVIQKIKLIEQIKWDPIYDNVECYVCHRISTVTECKGSYDKEIHYLCENCIKVLGKLYECQFCEEIAIDELIKDDKWIHVCEEHCEKYFDTSMKVIIRDKVEGNMKNVLLRCDFCESKRKSLLYINNDKSKLFCKVCIDKMIKELTPDEYDERLKNEDYY